MARIFVIAPAVKIICWRNEIRKMKAVTPHFEFKNINTTSAVLELVNNETSTFQVIIQKIDQESTTSKIILINSANLSGVKNSSDIPRLYITAQVTGNRVTIGDGKNYSGYANVPLDAGSTYRVYIRVVRQDNKGNMVYSEPRDMIFWTKQVYKPKSTQPSKSEGKKEKNVYNGDKTWLIVGVSVGVIVITIIIVTIVLSLRRVRQKAKEKRDKANDDKNMYMTVEDAIELKKVGTLKKDNKDIDNSNERTYATLGGTKTRPSANVEEKAYASLDEATRVTREPEAPKAPTSLYESLNNLNTCTTGQYENLDKVKKEATALTSVLKSI